MTASIALIIGSGFESLAGEGTSRVIETRFGKPSAAIHEVVLEGCPLLSIARHGDAHSIPPHAINYRANLVALHELGARSVVALNTVGVVSDVRDPGQLAVPLPERKTPARLLIELRGRDRQQRTATMADGAGLHCKTGFVGAKPHG